jgi:uncharacterized protein YjdB
VTLYGLYQRTLTLSYYANGGSSTPSNQTGLQYANSYAITNYSNPSITLAAAISRSGYSFSGWGYNSATGTKYNAGSVISLTTSATMYAVWYDISIDISGTYTFPSTEAGYSAQAPLNVTVTNTSSGVTGNLTATLSGADNNAFDVSPATIAGITAGGTGVFTVAPKAGLAAGTYAAVVTVTDANGGSKSFDVQFTVGDATPFTYLLTVTGGSGDGSYAAGDQISITAGPAPSGKVFDRWTSIDGGSFADANSASTTFTMPANAATVTAIYKIAGQQATEKEKATGAKVQSLTISSAPPSYLYNANLVTNAVRLRADILPSNAGNKDVTWKSNNAKIATVGASGTVTFKGAEGSVRITATAKDGSGKTAYKDINVIKRVTKIRTPQKTVYLTQGKKLALPIAMDDGVLTVTGANTFKSSDPAIAAVTAKGKITAKNPGKTTITVTARNGKLLNVTVNVVKKSVKLRKVKLSGTPKKLQAGKVKQLKISVTPKKATGLKITYKSSNKSVLTVDKAGKITALKEGKAYVTVKVGKKKVKTRKIQVTAPVSSLKATKTKVTLKKGKKITLKVTAVSKTPFMRLPQTGTAAVKAKLKWTSSKKSVVTVNSKGKIAALKKGKAKITAKALNGKKLIFTVTVR